MKRLLGMLMMGVSSAAGAHDWDKPPRWDAAEEWLVIALHADEASFLAGSLTKRAGGAVLFETLLVRSRADEHGQLQEHQHYLADCKTMTVRWTHFQSYDERGRPGPPRLVRTPRGYSGHVPEAGSSLMKAVQVACGLAPVPAVRATDPTKWARARFKR
jgi:hypothetical protein